MYKVVVDTVTHIRVIARLDFCVVSGQTVCTFIGSLQRRIVCAAARGDLCVRIELHAFV